jgi:two-component system, NarL family, nitrate/nitrite response regulator NarL
MTPGVCAVRTSEGRRNPGSEPVTVAKRVVIVDDHRMLAEAMALALRTEGYDVTLLEFPDEESSAESLLASLVQMHPRIVLLDLDLGPYGDGLPLVGPVIAAGADVVVMTESADPGRWAAALRAGARTVILKS